MRIKYTRILMAFGMILSASGLQAAFGDTPQGDAIVVKDDVPYLEIEDALNGSLLAEAIDGKEGVPTRKSKATGDITPRLSDFVKKKDVPRNGGEVVAGNTHLSFELRVSPETELVNMPILLTCVLSNRTDKPLQVYEGLDFYGITYFVTYTGITHQVISTIETPNHSDEEPYRGRKPLPPPLDPFKAVSTKQTLTVECAYIYATSLFPYPGEYTVHAIHESKATGITRSNDVKVKRRGPETDAERKALELVANRYVFDFLQRSKGVSMYANSTNTIAAVQALADLGDATPFHAAAVRTLKLLADWKEERRQYDEWYRKRVAERKAVEELAAKGLGPKWGEEPEFVYPQKPKRQFGYGAPVKGKIAEELTAWTLRMRDALARCDMKEFESYVAQDMEDITMEISTKTVKSRSTFIHQARVDAESTASSPNPRYVLSEAVKGVFLSDKEGEYIVQHVLTRVDTQANTSSVFGSVLWLAKYSGVWQLKRICYLGPVDENFEEIPWVDPNFTGTLKVPSAKPVLNSKTNAPSSK